MTRQSSSYSVSKKSLIPSPAGKAVFNNLRDLVDSEESESEKRARKTKKLIVLDSDEDSAGSRGKERDVDEEKKYSVITRDSSDVDKEEPLNSKKSSSKSDESDTGNMEVNRNKQDSASNGEDPCEVAGSDSE